VAPVKYLTLGGLILSGVKVYYGRGAVKVYAFEILGIAKGCAKFPSYMGNKVRYEDGTEGWKDHEYLLFSDLFYVREDDPAIDLWQLETFACPASGERHGRSSTNVDYLVWNDDGELVTCATCGLTYTPNGKPTIQVLPAETHEVAKEG
jgi:hypothetical protein